MKSIGDRLERQEKTKQEGGKSLELDKKVNRKIVLLHRWIGDR